MAKRVLVLILLSLLGAGPFTPADAQELVLVSKFLEGSIPLSDPHSSLWQTASLLEIPLASQVVTRVRTSELPQGKSAVRRLIARSLHNGKEIAFLLEWDDPTRDVTIERVDAFRDAMALQFPVKPPAKPGEIPVVTMGDEEKRVNIWQWRAEWQEQGRPSPVEDLVAEGFSTLTPKPMPNVAGKGAWSDGRWRVVLSRAMTTQDGDDAQFSRGGSLPIAFAVWEGSNQERGSQKSVSTWHRLRIE
jgi:DMSO reductase family type II enzyme heme b subunit